jgi:A/G-specific adenine glycosylase
MLQQTQVATVLPYYQRWIERFPNFEALAGASEEDVLHAWQGLGYYGRARNLHHAGKIISVKYGGHCPRQVEELKSLPGVARYTANAIASFAFAQRVPTVDANVGRVLARLVNVSVPIDSAAGRNAIWDIAAQLLPRDESCRFNSALMDLGATICTPRTPKCGICPVKSFCHAEHPTMLPVKRKRPPLKRLVETHGFLVRRGQILLEKSTGRWRGMWILPRLNIPPKSTQPIYASTFPFTHHRVKLVILRRNRFSRSKRGRWFPLHEIDSIPLPSPHRRAIIHLLQ